tara:strand:+ start:805 stop:987 length:183 start_codon:yes stop_codon:yes gene_type:complete
MNAQYFLLTSPVSLLILTLSACFSAEAGIETEDLPPATVEIVEAEIEIIDNTVGYAIILD